MPKSKKNQVQPRQARWWICTAPHHLFQPWLFAGCVYLRGQLEQGEGGFLHWQFVFCLGKKSSRTGLLATLGPLHLEPTRSEAALEYCWKDDTGVPGTRYELGARPMQRNSKEDWGAVWENAVSGELDAIPADIRVRCYNQLCRIAKDHMVALPIIRDVQVFWGPTGTGKSRRAWDQAGMGAYSKAPTTKWWDGYQGQENVVIDEFRGDISITHLLRWFDRYPVCVETKGGGVPLAARCIWITSNLAPDRWYPELDLETFEALKRRINITHFDSL